MDTTKSVPSPRKPGSCNVDKRAWRDGKIHYWHYFRSHYTSGIDAAVIILHRWARKKKKFNGEDLENFIKQMHQRLPFAVGGPRLDHWYDYRDSFEYCVEGRTDYDNYADFPMVLGLHAYRTRKCANCDNLVKGYDFCCSKCRVFRASFWHYCYKNKLSDTNLESLEKYISTKIIKLSKKIQRGAL